MFQKREEEKKQAEYERKQENKKLYEEDMAKYKSSSRFILNYTV